MGQQAPQSVFNRRDTFELTGKIDPYRPSEMKDSIQLTTFNMAGLPRDTAVLLDADGGFRIRVYRPYGSEIILTYSDHPIILYATASEKMHITLDMDDWRDGDGQGEPVKISGRSAGISKTIWEYKNYHHFREFPPDPYKDTSITDRQYAEKRIERMKKELAFLDLYNTVKKPVNPVFEGWCRNDIVYGAARDIVFRCFAGKINDQITHRQLMDLLKDFPLENPKALHSSQYYGYIYLLSISFMAIVNNNKEMQKAVRQQGNSRLAVCLQQVGLHATGLPQELMHYNIYTYALTEDKKELPVEKKLLRMVKDPVLKRGMVADRLGSPLGWNINRP